MALLDINGLKQLPPPQLSWYLDQFGEELVKAGTLGASDIPYLKDQLRQRQAGISAGNIAQGEKRVLAAKNAPLNIEARFLGGLVEGADPFARLNMNESDAYRREQLGLPPLETTAERVAAATGTLAGYATPFIGPFAITELGLKGALYGAAKFAPVVERAIQAGEAFGKARPVLAAGAKLGAIAGVESLGRQTIGKLVYGEPIRPKVALSNAAYMAAFGGLSKLTAPAAAAGWAKLLPNASPQVLTALGELTSATGVGGGLGAALPSEGMTRPQSAAVGALSMLGFEAVRMLGTPLSGPTLRVRDIGKVAEGQANIEGILKNLEASGAAPEQVAAAQRVADQVASEADSKGVVFDNGDTAPSTLEIAQRIRKVFPVPDELTGQLKYSQPDLREMNRLKGIIEQSLINFHTTQKRLMAAGETATADGMNPIIIKYWNEFAKLYDILESQPAKPAKLAEVKGKPLPGPRMPGEPTRVIITPPPGEAGGPARGTTAEAQRQAGARAAGMGSLKNELQTKADAFIAQQKAEEQAIIDKINAGQAATPLPSEAKPAPTPPEAPTEPTPSPDAPPAEPPAPAPAQKPEPPVKPAAPAAAKGPEYSASIDQAIANSEDRIAGWQNAINKKLVHKSVAEGYRKNIEQEQFIIDTLKAEKAKQATTKAVISRLPVEAATAAPANIPKESRTIGGLFIRFKGKDYPVSSMEDASKRWRTVVDVTGVGSKEAPGVPVMDKDGKQVAWISYNGKVWDREAPVGQTANLLYDPYKGEGFVEPTAKAAPPPSQMTMEGPTDAIGKAVATAERKALEKNGTIKRLPVTAIGVDADRFQFKIKHEKGSGAADSLKNVKVWNEASAGVLHVWQDPKAAEGTPPWVINGHTRLAKAKELGQPDVNVMFHDLPDEKAARATGALINLAEGRGTALDAAKLFKESHYTLKDLEAFGIPLSERTIRDGLALANLSPELWRATMSGFYPIERATLIGSKLTDPAQQKKLVEMVQQQEGRGKKITNDVISELADMVTGAPSKKVIEESLFGTDERAVSLAMERAEVFAYIRTRLSREKSLFGVVSKSRNAEELAGAGNVLNIEQNEKVSKEAAHLMAIFDGVKLRDPVSAIVNEAVKAIGAGEDASQAKQRGYDRVRQALSDLISKPKGGNAPGAGASDTARVAPSERTGPSVSVDKVKVGQRLVGARIDGLVSSVGATDVTLTRPDGTSVIIPKRVWDGESLKVTPVDLSAVTAPASTDTPVVGMEIEAVSKANGEGVRLVGRVKKTTDAQIILDNGTKLKRGDWTFYPKGKGPEILSDLGKKIIDNEGLPEGLLEMHMGFPLGRLIRDFLHGDLFRTVVDPKGEIKYLGTAFDSRMESAIKDPVHIAAQYPQYRPFFEAEQQHLVRELDTEYNTLFGRTKGDEGLGHEFLTLPADKAKEIGRIGLFAERNRKPLSDAELTKAGLDATQIKAFRSMRAMADNLSRRIIRLAKDTGHDADGNLTLQAEARLKQFDSHLGFYMPHSRWGDWAFKIERLVDGKMEFRMSESRKDILDQYHKFQAAYASDPAYKVHEPVQLDRQTASQRSQNDWKILELIRNDETIPLNIKAEMLKTVEKAVGSEVAGGHFLHRNDVPGFSEDFQRAFVDEGARLLGYEARVRLRKWFYSGETQQQLQAMPADLRHWTERHYSYILGEQPHSPVLGTMRRYTTAYWLAGSFQQLIQQAIEPMLTFASDVGNARVGKAYLDVSTRNLRPDEKLLFKGFTREGITDPSWVDALTAKGKKTGLESKAIDVALGFTRAGEHYSRLVSSLAAYRYARDAKGMNFAQSYDFARQKVAEHLGQFTAVNRPEFARNEYGNTVFLFTSWPIRILTNIGQFAGKGEYGKAAQSMIKIIALSGLAGLPGYQALSSVYKAATGRNTDDDMQKWLEEQGMTAPYRFALMRGAPGLAGLDLSSRFGLGYYPRVDFQGLAAGKAQAYADLGGPVVAAAQRIATGLSTLKPDALGRRDWTLAAQQGAPPALADVVQGVQSYKTGYLRTGQGDVATGITKKEALLMGAGITPARISQVRQERSALHALVAAHANVQGEFNQMLARAMLEKDKAQITSLLHDAATYNKTAKPSERINILGALDTVPRIIRAMKSEAGINIGGYPRAARSEALKIQKRYPGEVTQP